MKLILCKACQDVVKCQEEKRFCKCKKSWGQYIDDLYAEYGGEAIPLGFNNTTLVSAIRKRGLLGVDFDAFVIGTDSETFVKSKEG